jgi:hypothetical protein
MNTEIGSNFSIYFEFIKFFALYIKILTLSGDFEVYSLY